MSEKINSFTDPSKICDTFVEVCKILYSNRKFYLACFQYTGQNSLFDFIFDFFFHLWKDNLDSLQSSSMKRISEDELNIMAKLKTHSMLGMLTDWVRNGMRQNYMVYFEQMRSALEKGLK